MKDKLSLLQNEGTVEINRAKTNDELREIEIKILGRKAGELNAILGKIKDLPKEKRSETGQLANEVKKSLVEAIAKKRKELIVAKAAEFKYFDITRPGLRPEAGHLHPLTAVLRRINAIFTSMGFEVIEGPEIEEAKYNFDLLNIPKDHPARDLWDTFYLKEVSRGKSGEWLLRTHTSPMQIRAMEKRKPPVRLIVPGRVFRHEATDASHETTFYQVEGLVIDLGVRITDLIGTLRAFLENLFGKKIKIRVVPAFYPFVEPGMDIEMSCIICGGAGCSVCKKRGWLEMLGSGMVHSKVLKNMGVDPEVYSGFAFGLGVDRIMMLKHGINDIRLSYSGDLRFIKQF